MPILTFDQVTSERVKRLDAYWRSKITDRGLPRREDIDPTELRDILPYMLIADIEQNLFRIRYRLSGTMIQQYDEELHGRYLDELERTSEEDKALITAAYLRCHSDRPALLRSKVLSLARYGQSSGRSWRDLAVARSQRRHRSVCRHAGLCRPVALCRDIECGS